MLAFAGDYRDAATKIRKALAADEGEAAKRLCHTVKGSSGNLSALELEQAAWKLEQEIEAGQPERRDKALAEFEKALALVVNSIARLEQEGQGDEDETAEVARNVDPSEDLLRLELYLAEKDLKAEEHFRTIKKFLDYSCLRKDLHELEATISRLQFSEAKKIVREMIDKFAAGC